MNRGLRLWPWLPAMLLAGCATVPRVAPLATPLSDVQSAATFAQATGAWPQDRWWTKYGDPQLAALIDEALRDSPSLAAASARLRSAEAQARIAGSALLPAVSADGSLAEAKQSYYNGIPALFVPRGYHDNARTAAGFTWDPDLWGHNRDLLAAATSDAVAARADAAQARLVLTTSIAAIYADLSRLYADRTSTLAAADIRQQTLDIQRARAANGLETSGTVGTSLSQDRSAQSDVVAIDETIASDRAQLAALLGKGPDRGLTIAPPRITLSAQPVPADLGIDLVARRPDIAALIARLQAHAARVKAARKDFYPNISLSGLFGLQSLDIASFTRVGSQIGSLGGAVHLPLFDGGRLAAAWRGQRADYDAAVADYDAALLNALRDVATTLSARRTLEVRAQQLAAAQDAAQTALDVAQARYQAQLTSRLNVLTAQDSVVAIHRARDAVDARRIAVDVDLIRLLGGGYTSPRLASSARP